MRFHFVGSLYHIVAISESWLHAGVLDSSVSLAGFTILRNDRLGKVGGGVALYICNSLRGRILAASPSLYSGVPEYLIVEVKSLTIAPFLVSVVYRPPKTANLASFGGDFDRFSCDYSFSIVLGDFNANQLSCSYEAENVRSFCLARALHMVPFLPTYHSSTADSLLDLCLVSDRDFIVSYGQSGVPFIAGHDLVFVCLAWPVPSESRLISARSYAAFSADDYVRVLDASSWDPFLSPASVDDLVLCLQGNLTAALDTLAPYRSFTAKRTAPPWISPELRAQLRARDALYRRYKRSRSSVDLLSYRNARDSLHRRISSARSLYYSDRLSGVSCARELWNELRSLGLVSSQRSDCAGFSVEELNVHFASVSCRPAAALEVAEFFDALSPPEYDDSLFYFSDISPAELSAAISHFSSQSRGVDDLSLRNVKDALMAVFPYLLHLFNQSLSTAVFPGAWKKARVIPLAKVKSPSSLQQMRPIANLCLLSKVLERIVLVQIMTFLESRSLLDSRQSGFRWGRSTQSALLLLLEDVRRGIDSRQVTILVLFDFTKAFDSIPHSFLLSKLLALGFSQHVLSWVTSYLRGRSQAVVGTSGELSSWAALDQGVPQGSVLGPLLFVIFINDLHRVLSHTQHLLYADDLQIYLHCAVDDVPEAIQRLNEDVAAVFGWSCANSLSLNPLKTQSIILGSLPFVTRLNSAVLPQVLLNGVPIPFSQTVRNLGLRIDSSLSWVPLVDAVSSRVHCALRQLSASRPLLSRSLRERLVVALVFPLLDYCSVVYCDIPGVLNTRLQRLLNCCVRFVSGVSRDEHITPYRRELGWLCARDRRLFFLCSLFVVVIRSGSPDYLRALFVARSEPLSGSSRRVRGDFVIPRFATEAFRRSFSVSALYLWDSLPSSLRLCRSLAVFKSSLRQFLFDTEFTRERVL